MLQMTAEKVILLKCNQKTSYKNSRSALHSLQGSYRTVNQGIYFTIQEQSY